MTAGWGLKLNQPVSLASQFIMCKARPTYQKHLLVDCRGSNPREARETEIQYEGELYPSCWFQLEWFEFSRKILEILKLKYYTVVPAVNYIITGDTST